MLNGVLPLLQKFFCPLQEAELSLKLSNYLMLLFEHCAFASKFTDVSLELQKNNPSVINKFIVLESLSFLQQSMNIKAQLS